MTEALSMRPEMLVDDPEVDEATAARIRSLQQLQAVLRGAAAGGTRQEFCSAFARAQHVLELDDLDLARAFQISRPTVGRWTRGEAAPHPVGRKPILDALFKRAAAKLRQLEG